MVGRVKTGDECTHEEPRRDFLFLFLLKFYGKWLLGEGWRRRRRGENKTDILYYNRPTHDRGSVLTMRAVSSFRLDFVGRIRSGN